MSDKKVIVTMYAKEAAALRSVALPTLEQYAGAHGFDAVLEAPAVAGLPPAWGKVAALQRAIEDYDLAVWIDGDAAFLPGAPDLAACLPADAFQAFCHHPWVEFKVNSWLWVVRGGDDDTEEFLRAVWAGSTLPQAHAQPWELTAIHRVLREQPHLLARSTVLHEWSESTFGRPDVERFAKHTGYPHGSYEKRAAFLANVLGRTTAERGDQ